MIRLEPDGTIHPTTWRDLPPEHRAAVTKARMAAVVKARTEHERKYHAPARRADITRSHAA